MRVQAVYQGFYNGDYKDVGDVFDLLSVGDLSDSTVSVVSSDNPDYPLYGWMLIVPDATSLFSFASTGQSAPDAAIPRRTVF
jgi:hypothetical protein